jgi:phage terminase small subunit
MPAKKKPIPAPTITLKQQRFIDCYDGDIEPAALSAGITYGYGRQLMVLSKHAHVQEAIRGRELTKSNNRIATREERQEFWTKVYKGEESQPIVTGHREDGTAIVEDIPQPMRDRLKASELLGKSEADFIERKRIEDADGKPLKWKIEIVQAKDDN